jgi:hypothetical protein
LIDDSNKRNQLGSNCPPRLSVSCLADPRLGKRRAFAAVKDANVKLD